MIDVIDTLTELKDIQSVLTDAKETMISNSAAGSFKLGIGLGKLNKLVGWMEEEIIQDCLSEGICPNCYLKHGYGNHMDIIEEKDTGYQYYQCHECGWKDTE